MKAWVHGTTWESDPGPMGAGVIFEDGKDWCVALSGWGTTDDATWNALSLCVEYAVTEYEPRRLRIYCDDSSIVKQATSRWYTVRSGKLHPLALDFWRLRTIARKLGVRVKVKTGEVRHAAAISNAAAEIAADTLGVEQEEAGRSEGEGAD